MASSPPWCARWLCSVQVGKSLEKDHMIGSPSFVDGNRTRPVGVRLPPSQLDALLESNKWLQLKEPLQAAIVIIVGVIGGVGG